MRALATKMMVLGALALSACSGRAECAHTPVGEICVLEFDKGKDLRSTLLSTATERRVAPPGRAENGAPSPTSPRRESPSAR